MVTGSTSSDFTDKILKAMKRFYPAVFGLTVILLSVSCNDDNIVSNYDADGLVRKITVTADHFEFEDAITRSYYTLENNKTVFHWENTDTVGIYPIGGTQVDFPISSAGGGSVAEFDGGAWALRKNWSYAAYYPFSAKNFHISDKAIPVTFIGQVQKGDNSMHFDRFAYQASKATSPDDNGEVSIKLNLLESMMRIKLTMPVPDTYTKLTLTSNNQKFITTGTVDLSAETPAIIPTQLSASVSMDLKNISTTEPGQTITLWMMAGSVDQSSSTITATVSGVNNKSYSTTFSGRAMAVTGGYAFSGTCTTGKNQNDEEISWAADGSISDGHGHYYVDLGLPSGLMWATFNLGASSQAGFGGYYAWGENDEKDVYNAGSYTADPGFAIYNNNGGDTELGEYSDDAARETWGDFWRMPTADEFKELLDNCDFTLEELNSTAGYKVTSKANGNWIFLPLTGYAYEETTAAYNTEYLSRSLSSSDEYSFALALSDDNPSYNEVAYADRVLGYPIRPVHDPYNGHKFVDLGLPSGTMWATCNIGATEPTGYGDYFAWGETEPYYNSLSPLAWNPGKSEGYKWDSYFDVNGFTFDKYYNDGGLTVLDAGENDAARSTWGGSWRMPDASQFEELVDVDNCEYEIVNENSVFGIQFTSKKNGNKLFLPLASHFDLTDLPMVGNVGAYWTRNLSGDDSRGISFIVNIMSASNINIVRYDGLSVRPVFVSNPIAATGLTLDETKLDIYENDTYTLTATVLPANATDKHVTWTSSNTAVATVNQSGKVTPVSLGKTTITATCGSLETSCEVTVVKAAYVDLGLSVKWAICNVGAENPWNVGSYFAWGETEEKEVYDDEHYFDAGHWIYSIEGEHVLQTANDAAAENMGSGWRMPTADEMMELITNCDWTFTENAPEFNNVAGFKVANSSDPSKYIFLPFTGSKNYEGLSELNIRGLYWTSSLDDISSDHAVSLDMLTSGNTVSYVRITGMAVRGVHP